MSAAVAEIERVWHLCAMPPGDGLGAAPDSPRGAVRVVHGEASLSVTDIDNGHVEGSHLPDPCRC